MSGLFSARCRSEARLDGKTAVVTGANTGIGKEVAHGLARRGACVVMACRDMQKAEKALAELRTKLSGCEGAGELVLMNLDLGSLASVRACARLLLDQYPRIHLLINNAATVACPYTVTEDGFEMQLGVNHFGHFLLTCLLLPRLRASAPARIVVVSSRTHTSTLDFDDLLMEKNYGPFAGYMRSKLANILFAKDLGKRLEGTGVTTYSVHPGAVATEAGRHFDSTIFRGATRIFTFFTGMFFMSPEKGAQTPIYCAVEESLSDETGFYYSDCRKTTPARCARDDETGRRLWEESLRLTGLVSWDPCTAPDGSQPQQLPTSSHPAS